ncbi:MAG: hypothetical protein M5U28_37750 [Sandaracinaceae bacterium]|nr:hypothetical protein [Sandaracinaceae bacterium]
MEEREAGPFRTAEPTPEVRLAREREASFERVRAWSEEAAQAEQRRERSRDRLAWAALALSALATLGAVALTGVRATAAPFVCPAGAALFSAIVVVAVRWRRLR